MAVFLLCLYVKGGCLSTSDLNKLGFSNTQSLQKIEESSVCKGLFRFKGSCVGEKDVRNKVEEETALVSEKMDIYAELNTVLKKMKNSIADKEVKERFDILIKEMNYHKHKCKKTYITVQNGVTCLLASGFASENVNTENELFTIKVSANELRLIFNDCMNLFEAFCLITSGVSISFNISLDNYLFKAKYDVFGEACENLKKHHKCDGDPSCFSIANKTLVDSFIRPYNYFIFPLKSELDNLANQMDFYNKEIEELINKGSERRLAESGVKVRLEGINEESLADLYMFGSGSDNFLIHKAETE